MPHIDHSAIALWSLAATVASWWSATAAVLLAVRAHAVAPRAVLLVATTLATTALFALRVFAGRSDLVGVFGGFGCAIVVWGWVELLFLTGRVVGPRDMLCRAGCAGLPHAGHALRAILHHEAALVASAVALAVASSGRADRTGVWTFVILLAMRFSAQLNLFLGVRNLSEEWLPAALLHLRPFLRKRAMNPLLPFSIAAAASASGLLARHALDGAASEPAVASSAVLATLAGLGALEHLLLVLPFDPTRLWPGLETGQSRDRIERRD